MEGCLKAESSIFPGAPWPPTLFQPGLAPKLNKQIPNMYSVHLPKYQIHPHKYQIHPLKYQTQNKPS